MSVNSPAGILPALQKIHREKLAGYVSIPVGNQFVVMIFCNGGLASFDEETLDLFFLPFLRKQKPAEATSIPPSISSTDIPLLRQHREIVLAFVLSTIKEFVESGAAGPVTCEDRPVAPPLRAQQLVDIPEIIIPLYSETLAAPAVRELFPDFSAPVSLHPQALETARRLTLTPQQGYVLSRIQSGCSLRELVLSTGLPEDLILRSLAILLFFDCVRIPGGSAGRTERPSAAETRPSMEDLLTTPSPAHAAPQAVRPESPNHSPGPVASHARRNIPPASTSIGDDILLGNAPPAAPAPETSRPEPTHEVVLEIDDLDLIAKRNNYYEILDVDRRADADILKKRFVELTKKYHPDKFQRYNDPDLQSKVDHIFAKITEAWEVLKDPAARAAYDDRFQLNSADSPPAQHTPSAEDSPPPTSAKMAYEDREHRARQHFIHGKEDFKNKKFHEALEHFRESVRQVPGIAEYQFMLGKTLAMNPQRVREAEERLRFALDKQPHRLEFVLELARFYHKNNLSHRAQRYYRQVLELKPDHDEALFMLGMKKSIGKRKKSAKPKTFKDYLKLDLKDIFKSEE